MPLFLGHQEDIAGIPLMIESLPRHHATLDSLYMQICLLFFFDFEEM